MKKLALAALALATAGSIGAQAPAQDNLLKAMHDEIEPRRQTDAGQSRSALFRGVRGLRAGGFPVTATLGGLLSRRHDRFRLPSVKIRVGDYKFDNTNYVGSSFNFGSRYDLERFPLEDNYPLLRRYLWLMTDSAYKSAVEAISRKRAALRNIQQGDQLDDFAHAEPVKSLRAIKTLHA